MADPRPSTQKVSDSIARLRDEVRAARRALKRAAPALNQAAAGLARLAALDRGDPDLGARLDRLEGVLEPRRVTAHLQAAAARLEIIERPAPHALVAGLLPDDLYQAVLQAIPPRTFFNDSADRRLDLPLPPALAPTDAMVTWRFLVDVMATGFAPLLVERFRAIIARHAATLAPAVAAGGLRLIASQGRLLLRLPGYQPPPRRAHPSHFLTTVVWLGSQGESAAYGSLVRGPGDPAATVRIPFTPNAALVVFDPEGAHEYDAIPGSAAEMTRCCYEFPIGPDRETRRRLTILAGADT